MSGAPYYHSFEVSVWISTGLKAVIALAAAYAIGRLFTKGHEMNTHCARPNKAIRDARVERGLTQAEAAEAAGMSRAHLSLVELGISGISVERALRLAEVLGITVEQIFGSEGSK